MKKIKSPTVFIPSYIRSFILGICFLVQIQFIQAENHAFIIAIGDYPVESGWSKISSLNDVHHIQAALQLVGFHSANIQVITDREATHDGILIALNRFIKKLQKGDQVYIHYSGHGQQIVDDQEGEEIDQLDEAIVPFDSPMYFEAGIYEGENLIRDDLLAQLSLQIRKKIGKSGQVIWVLDSCHSGTGLRGIGKARGTDYIMAEQDFKPKNIGIEKSMQLQDSDSESLAPMLSLFGSSPHELNFETLDDQNQSVGSLSYAISKVMLEMDQAYSFQEFFGRIQQKMKNYAPRQHPQWEGPEQIIVFEGQLRSPETESIQVIERIDGTHVKVSVGTLTDVFEESSISVFVKANPTNSFIGKVIYAQFNNSIVEFEEVLPFEQDEMLEARIQTRAIPPLKLLIRMDLKENGFWNSTLQQSLTQINYQVTDVNPDLYIYEKDKRLIIETREGIQLGVFDVNQTKDSISQALKNLIQSFLQAQFLRSYENERSDFDFSLEIELVDCKTEEKLELNSGGQISLKVGSCIKFKVRNTGLIGGYFSLIDIQADNVINLIIPAIQLDYTASEYFLKPGEEFVTHYVVEIAEPLGEETLKLLTSKKPLELANIISSQGEIRKGMAQLNEFEQQFASSYVKSNASIIRKNTDDIGTKTLYLFIVDKD